MPWDPDYADYMDEQSNEVDLQQLFTERQVESIRAAQQDSDDHVPNRTP